MVDIQHKDITGADAAHPPFYASESDPTTTLGAYRGWIKPSTGEVKIRNSTNTAWLDISVTGTTVPDASETVEGVAEIATQTETNAGADDLRIVTPAKLAGRTATDTRSGVVELATQTETDAGTDTTRVVTPDTLANYSGLGGAGHTIQDEGTPTTARANLNFTGAGVTVSDDSANDQTDIDIPGGVTDPASETVAGIAELATQTEVDTGTDTQRIVTPATLAGRTATETRSGVAEIATQTETNAGADDLRIVTPAKLAGKTATDTRAGVVELATDAETQTGTDATRAITPANLSARSATETRAGIAEIATQAETDAGTDDARIVTPAKLANYSGLGGGGGGAALTQVYAEPSTAQTLPSASNYHTVVFDTTGEVDTLGEFVPSTGIFTASGAKRVLVVALIAFNTNTTGTRIVRLYKNNAQTRHLIVMPPVTGNVTLTPFVAAVDLAGGDTLDVRANMDGATGTLQIANTVTSISISEVDDTSGGGGGGGGRTIVTLGSDVANATTSLANVTGLSFSVPAGESFNFEAQIVYHSSNTSVGSQWAADAGDYSQFGMMVMHALTTTSSTIQNHTASNDGVANATSATTFDNICKMWGRVEANTTSTFIIRFAAETTGTITAKAGSTLEYWQ